MKVSKQVLALMVALAVGTAAAGSAGTTAGKSITNTATASYDDPTAPGTPLTKNSNTVTTNLNAVTGFDIVYTSPGAADGTSASTPYTNLDPTLSYDKANVLAGATVATTYTVINNSNIDGYLINVAPDTTGSGTTLPVGNVKYYPAGTTSFVPANEITSVTLANGAQVDIIQVITIPAGATANQQYSASPKGTAPAGSTTAVAGTSVAVAYALYNEATNQNVAGTPSPNGDLQYTRATIYSPLLTETPTAPTTSTVTPPTPTTPGQPNNPVSPPGTPVTNDSTNFPDPSQPGSVDPTNPSTAIAVNVAGNNQTAFPLTGVTTVTFNNQVNNTGTLPDTVKLFPANAGGLPLVAPSPTGVFTLLDGTVIRFLNSTTGLPLPVDANGYPIITAPAGGTVNYRTEVSNFPIVPANPEGTVITVGISSGNKSGAVSADATTTDTILPPGLQFGDNDAGAPNGGFKGPGDAAQVVDPSKAVSTAPVTDAGVNTDRTAVFPMVIKNTGEYNDTYTLQSSTITFKNADGTTTDVKVKYVDATGAPLPTNTAGDYFTPVVLTDAQLTVYAVVDVPATAAATNGTLTGANPNYAFDQKATANYSGAVITDSVKDQIQVGTFGSIAVDKYSRVNAAIDASFIGTTGATNPKGANPKDTVNYAIVAKNNYNTPVKNFILKDSNGAGTNTFTFSDYQSASVVLTSFPVVTTTPTVVTPTPYFSTDSGANWTAGTNTAGTWTPAAPLTVGAAGIWVYVETDGVTPGINPGPSAGDVIPAGASVQLNISTKIK